VKERERRLKFGLVNPEPPRVPGSVAIGFPVGGSWAPPFGQSLLQIEAYELGKPPDRRLLRHIFQKKGLYIADNRQDIASRFLAMEIPWLLQIDTDIEFPPTLIETMLSLAGEDRKVLAASVPLEPYPTCAFRLTGPGLWESVPVGPVPREVDGIATAVALIHRDVFLRIAERHGRTWFHHIYLPNSPEGTPLVDFEYLSQGEDLAFSVRAAEAGFKIWCAYVPGIRHHKTVGLSHDDERAKALAAQDEGVGEIVAEG
jgi:hypothetical protein